jgi:hypothetical protein
MASKTHPLGSRIVPKVNLAGTSLTAVGEGRGKVSLKDLEDHKE